MRIQLSPSSPFNLDATLCCGQAFRWDKHGDWWHGVVREKPFKIRQIRNELEFEDVDADFIEDYFGLHDDLSKILKQIARDSQVEAAVKRFKGLRILRQDPWECLISYICATYKNIPAIKKMLHNLSEKFGDKAEFNGYSIYTFPTPERLARTTTKELARCSLGYRSRYVSETAKMVYEDGFEFKCLREMPYDKAREELLDFPGVGMKVADCVLLFSLGKLEAFPVDLWMKRVVLKYYASHFPSEFVRKISSRKFFTISEYKKLSLFGQRYFGEYAGYAQEYLYHYERTRC